MTLTGIDLSNLQGHPSGYRNAAWYKAAQFVIVQAIEPPSGFPGHDFIDPETGKRGYTGVQLRAAKEDGKFIGVYVWLWNGLADTRGNILARLATVPASLKLDMRPWVDVEDVTGGPNGLSVTTRQNNTIDARAAADEWAATQGLPPSGGYSGSWYIDGYLGGFWPARWLYWLAGYDRPPEVLPMRPVHQFSSTPIDQDVMLESEIVSVLVMAAVPQEETEMPVPQDYQDKFGCGPTDWTCVTDHLEGIIHQVQGELATATVTDTSDVAGLTAKLDKIKAIVS